MAFNTPSRETIEQRLRSQIETALPGVDPTLRRAFVRVLPRALAEELRGLYLHQKYLSKQFIPPLADDDNLPVWLDFFEIEPKPAAFAVGTAAVRFTGNDGATIPKGAILQRGDGEEFTVTADATIAGGQADADVKARVAGTAGNTEAGGKLTLVNPVAGVTGEASVVGDGITGGADPESRTSQLERLAQRMANPPGPGNEGDYERWTLEVAGVAKAWVYRRHQGLGTVGITFLQDDGTVPQQAKLDEVEAYLADLAPVNDELVLFAPSELDVDFTIQLDPNDADTRAAVQAQLEDLFDRKARPGGANGEGVLYLSQIREAIALAPGEVAHNLVAPAADIEPSVGELPRLGTITWQGYP